MIKIINKIINKNVNKRYFLALFLLAASNIFAQLRIDKIEPPNWWVGMKWNEVQIMVYGDDLNNIEASFNTDKIKVVKVHGLDNPSYAFIDIVIDDDLQSGEYVLTIRKENSEIKTSYFVNEQVDEPNRYQGFSNEDVIYLLMPDRFANGDAANDFVEGYIDSMQHIPTQQRKGGDIQGVIYHLDYIKEFGATTVWLTPVVENNTFRSYHGYAPTNHYMVDPRLGTNELYKQFVEQAHERGLKIIMDHVSNHISKDHPWIDNLPMPDWINGTIENHLNANHNKMVYADVHHDSSIIRQVHEGWFTNYMPDLNQSNLYLANYLIQNTLWWIEYAGVDGIREDTYPYSDQEFMSKWAEAIIKEYPNFNIVAEVWTGEPAFLSTYQSGSHNPKRYDSNAPSITDFGIRDTYVDFLSGKKGIYNIYNTFAKDFLYHDPGKLVTFVDNHDVGRAMFYADSNVSKFKLVYQMLLTTRGIPQIFYGTEIGMIENEDHGTLRKPFPGGWQTDERNAFTREGRTEYENDIYDYLTKLTHLRKKYKSLSIGEITHFPPVDDVYVYFKKYGKEMIMNVINSADQERVLNLSKYAHMIGKNKTLHELMSNSVYNIENELNINVKPLSGVMLKVCE